MERKTRKGITYWSARDRLFELIDSLPKDYKSKLSLFDHSPSEHALISNDSRTVKNYHLDVCARLSIAGRGTCFEPRIDEDDRN
eukprot:scaffold24532_cov157-Cylindrotheca_fusiformis.AAC.6